MLDKGGQNMENFLPLFGGWLTGGKEGINFMFAKSEIDWSLICLILNDVFS
jgi:hypothetical protein